MKTIYSTLFIALLIFIISSCTKDDFSDNDGPTAIEDSTETGQSPGIFVHDTYGDFAITNYQLEIYKGEYSWDSLINLTPDEVVLTGADGFGAISSVPPITVLGSKPGYTSFFTKVGQWPESGFQSTTTYKISWVKVLLHDVTPLNVDPVVFVMFQNIFVLDPWSYNGDPPIEYYGSIYLSNIQGDTSAIATVTAGKSMVAGLGSGQTGIGSPHVFKSFTSLWSDTLEVSLDY